MLWKGTALALLKKKCRKYVNTIDNMNKRKAKLYKKRQLKANRLFYDSYDQASNIRRQRAIAVQLGVGDISNDWC